MDKLGVGRKMERLAMKQWEWYGFRTWQPPRAKYADQDIFGLFDFVAVHPDSRIQLVQVKRHNSKELERARTQLEAFVRDFPVGVGIYLVSWVKRRKSILMRSQAYMPSGQWEPCADWYAEEP